MKVLVLDNYDSFTYNLVQLLRENDKVKKVDVFRNDKITLEQVGAYDKILLSPGPSLPKDAGIMPELIKQYAGKKSILGICLGHQAIGEAFGGELYNLSEVMHGVASDISQTSAKDYIFKDISPLFSACRYHSWAVKSDKLSAELEVTAVDESGVIMALRHKKYDLRGLQFHPESVLTPEGRKMVENWVEGS